MLLKTLNSLFKCWSEKNQSKSLGSCQLLPKYWHGNAYLQKWFDSEDKYVCMCNRFLSYFLFPFIWREMVELTTVILTNIFVHLWEAYDVVFFSSQMMSICKFDFLIETANAVLSVILFLVPVWYILIPKEKAKHFKCTINILNIKLRNYAMIFTFSNCTTQLFFLQYFFYSFR